MQTWPQNGQSKLFFQEQRARAMPQPFVQPTPGELQTIRDWLRFAVTSFTRAQLEFGHGTDNALDEAAFVILSCLDLEPDSLETWLECRLTTAEGAAVSEFIARRIESRKPASYLTNSAWIGKYKFYVDERVIVPRSFIGELLCRDGLATVAGGEADVTKVLDLCTGSGCLAILAALAFPDAHVDAVDISPDALQVCRRNVAGYKLGERITVHQGDLFDGLPKATYDLIISNPPYVTAAAVKAFPPEYRAEPELAHLGGEDGLDLVHRILGGARQWLSPQGTLVVEVGDGRERLERARPQLPFLWLDTATSEGEVFALPAAGLDVKAGAPTRGQSKKSKPAR